MSSKNFILVFGIIWTAITAFITIMMLVTSGMIQGVLSTNPDVPNEINFMIVPMLLFMSIFWIIGIAFLVIGIKKYKTDKNTEEYGEECFAKIRSVYFSGTVVNNRREYKADFLVYIPSERRVKKISETIGFDPMDYPENGYVKVKYYQDDINIKETLSVDFVPKNIKNFIEDYKGNQPELEESNSNWQSTSKDDGEGPISFQ